MFSDYPEVCKYSSRSIDPNLFEGPDENITLEDIQLEPKRVSRKNLRVRLYVYSVCAVGGHISQNVRITSFARSAPKACTYARISWRNSSSSQLYIVYE